MEGVQAQETLAHVHESLGDSNHEKLVLRRVARIVRRQVAEIAGELGVVGAGTNETERENSSHRGLCIRVIGQLVEEIEGDDVRVRDSEQTNRERHRPPDDGLTVLEQVVHCSQTHFLANLLAEGDQSDSKHSCDLMDGLLLVLLMLCTEMEHLLDFEDIA